MSYGHIPPEAWKNLITVWPGPTIRVWRNGADYCDVPLSPTATLDLIGRLTAAPQLAQTNTPNEGLPVKTHIALRDAERQPFADHIGRSDE